MHMCRDILKTGQPKAHRRPPGRRRRLNARRTIPVVDDGLRAHYEHVLESCGSGIGSLLDVGCGRGGLLEVAATMLTDLRLAVGVERGSEYFGESGLRRNHRLMVGDGENLGLASGAFGAVVSIGALEWTGDPIGFLRESARVCADGGRVVAVHTDWDTIVYAVADETLARRLLRDFSDNGPVGWMGRRLPSLMRRAGLGDIECRVDVILERTYDAESYGNYLAHVIAAWLRAKRAASDDEISRWLADLDVRHRDGDYLFSANRYIGVGRRGADRRS